MALDIQSNDIRELQRKSVLEDFPLPDAMVTGLNRELYNTQYVTQAHVLYPNCEVFPLHQYKIRYLLSTGPAAIASSQSSPMSGSLKSKILVIVKVWCAKPLAVFLDVLETPAENPFGLM